MDARAEQLIKKSQRQFRAKVIFVLIALLIIVSGMFIKATYPNRRTLLDHATLVTDWSHAKTSSGARPGFISDHFSYVFDHHWLPDGTLIRIPFAVIERGKRFTTVSTQLEKIDPKTGKVLDSKQLDLTTAQRDTLYEPPVSPDGKRLFMLDSGDIAMIDTETGKLKSFSRGGFYNNMLTSVVVTSRGQEGSSSTYKPGAQPLLGQGTDCRQLANRIAWARDSQSFFAMTLNAALNPCMQQRSLDDKLIASFPFVAWTGGASLPQILGQTSNGEILLIDRNFFEAENLYFVDLKLKTIRKEPIKGVLRGTEVKQVELSPDGRRLLWKTTTVKPSLTEFFQDLAESMQHRESRCKTSIAVSGLDGSNAKEVAFEKMTGLEEDDFRTVHWLPDSKRVSFWYKGSIYTIPAK